ncbi:hypothetical protein YC2023_070642 [Brassica napus]
MAQIHHFRISVVASLVKPRSRHFVQALCLHLQLLLDLRLLRRISLFSSSSSTIVSFLSNCGGGYRGGACGYEGRRCEEEVVVDVVMVDVMVVDVDTEVEDARMRRCEEEEVVVDVVVVDIVVVDVDPEVEDVRRRK